VLYNILVNIKKQDLLENPDTGELDKEDEVEPIVPDNKHISHGYNITRRKSRRAEVKRDEIATAIWADYQRKLG
jgi:hypothetical protein